MHKFHARSHSWKTSSFGSAPVTSALDLAALGAHFRHCEGRRGKLFGFACAREALDGFMAPRLVTSSMAIFAIASAVSALWP